MLPEPSAQGISHFGNASARVSSMVFYSPFLSSSPTAHPFLVLKALLPLGCFECGRFACFILSSCVVVLPG